MRSPEVPSNRKDFHSRRMRTFVCKDIPKKYVSCWSESLGETKSYADFPPEKVADPNLQALCLFEFQKLFRISDQMVNLEGLHRPVFCSWDGSQVDSIGNHILVLVPKALLALLYALFSDLIQFEHLDLSNRYEWDGIELFLFCISFVSVFWTVFRSHWISSGCWLLVARHPSPHSQTILEPRCSHSAWGQNTLCISWMSCFFGQRIDGTRSR